MAYLSLVLLLLLKASSIFGIADLQPICTWNQMDFLFPTTQDRINAINNGLFVQQNVIPIDVDVDYHGEKLIYIVKLNAELTWFFNYQPRIGCSVQDLCHNTTIILSRCSNITWIYRSTKNRLSNQALSEL